MEKLKAWCDNKSAGLTELPLTFYCDGYLEHFKLDNRARNTLNKVFDTQFLAVYREVPRYSKQWSAADIDWCGERVYIVTSKRGIVSMQNSEWAFIGKEH
jgi:hypothetical protein